MKWKDNISEVPQDNIVSKYSHSEVCEWISTTINESKSVLDLSYYEELFKYAKEKSDKDRESDFDIDQFYEDIFDYYWEYSLIDIYNILEYIIENNREPYTFARNYLCSLKIEAVPLKRLIKRYENEDLDELKSEILLEIQKHLEKLFSKYKFTLWTRNKEEYLDIPMLYSINSSDWIYMEMLNSIMSAYIMNDIVFFLQKIKFEERFKNEIWTLDLERLKQETQKFWAKWANLIIIRDLIDKILNFLNSLKKSCYIPDFDTIPVAIYDKWVKWEDITADIKPYYDWIKWRKIKVRSSAVYSEDGEDSTWAGIYDSIEFNGKLSIEEFKNIVIQVYTSVNSDRAIAYRKRKWIKEEKMGIVIHEFVDEEGVDYKTINSWYVNTVVKWVPSLMDIVLDNWIRPVIDRTVLEKKCGYEWQEESIFYYQIDKKKLEGYYIINSLSIVCYLLEKYYKKTLQIEFKIKECFYKYNDSNLICAILQSRFLPKNYSEIMNIEFPNKQILFEWRALWVCDLELDVLPNRMDNSQKNWIVIFETSKLSSIWQGMNENNLPQSGVVIVLWPTKELSWHIETLCAERWLLFIFNQDYKFSDIFELPSCYLQKRANIQDLNGYKRLHIVMDWLVGKVFIV